MANLDQLIDELADEATPVRVQRAATGRLALLGVGLATLVGVAVTYGFRLDVMQLRPPSLVAITAGLSAILATAAGTDAVRMARPQVGAAESGAPWLLAAVLLVPLAALAAIAANPAESSGLAVEPGLRCLTFGLTSGVATFLFLALWLRRGAPVNPNRAAWLAGMASGAVGALAVTLECAHVEIAHIGFWHVAVVPLFALLGRLALPRLIRW